MNKRILLFTVGVFMLAACGTPATAVKTFTKGDELAFYDFTQSGSFEEGIYADGAARLEISSGTYNISLTEGDSTFYYGQWGDKQSDVIVDVEARQLSEDQNTTYGVMCRARGEVGIFSGNVDAELAALAEEVAESPALLPSLTEATAEATSEATAEAASEATAEATSEATAEATSEATAEATSEATSEATREATAEATTEATAEATRESAAASDATPAPAGGASSLNARSVNNGDGYLFLVGGSGRFAIMRAVSRTLTPLVNWTDSAAINKGAAQNRIRAVCMGNYLALYVNGQFLGDSSDDTYADGQVALVAAAAGRTGLEASFDNLTVSAAKPE